MTNTATNKLQTAEELFLFLSQYTEKERSVIYLEQEGRDGWSVSEREEMLSDGSTVVNLTMREAT